MNTEPSIIGFLRDPESWRDMAGRAQTIGYEVAPGTGDVIAAQRGAEFTQDALDAARAGEVAQALGSGASGLAEYLTTVPVLGDAAGLAKASLGGLGMLGTLGKSAIVDALRAQQNVRGEAPGELGDPLPKMSKDAAREAGYPLEAHHSPYGSVKLETPLGEVTREVSISGEVAPERIVTLEDMEGGLISPAPGDVSDVGALLHALRGREFDPVGLHGGPGYSRLADNEGMAWASDPKVVDAMLRKATAAQDRGQDAYLAYTKMSPRALDFNNMVAETMMKVADLKAVSAADAKEFDAAVRDLKVKDGDTGEMKAVFPDWVGIKDPKAAEQLAQVTGGKRSALIGLMDKKKWRDKGFPDIAEVRQGVSSPDFLDVPEQSMGAAIMRIDPSKPITEVPHPTYPSGLGGEYFGRLERPVPFREMLQGFNEGRRTAGKSPSSDFRSMMMTLPTQNVTPELIEALRSRGY